MEFVVKSPGACGELIQGQINGQNFLVTCPIERYSIATAWPKTTAHTHELPYKAQQAVTVTKEYLKIGQDIDVVLYSELKDGKGMASSSADISAVCLAVALAAERHLSMQELAHLALSIEPSDATFYPGIVQFDHLQGRFLRPLGHFPEAYICIFDQGGVIDTVEFNAREDLINKRAIKEKEIQKALTLLIEGLRKGDMIKIGTATTMSAYANQEILPRPYLADLHAWGKELGSNGVIVAHSGTVCGLLLTDLKKLDDIRKGLAVEFGNTLTFLDCVKVYNGGIHFVRRS